MLREEVLMRCLQQSETHLGEQNSRPKNALNGRKTRLSFQIQSPNWCENRKGRVAKRTSERLNGSFHVFLTAAIFPKVWEIVVLLYSVQTKQISFYGRGKWIQPIVTAMQRIIIVKCLRCPVSRIGDIFFFVCDNNRL